VTRNILTYQVYLIILSVIMACLDNLLTHCLSSQLASSDQHDTIRLVIKRMGRWTSGLTEQIQRQLERQDEEEEQENMGMSGKDQGVGKGNRENGIPEGDVLGTVKEEGSGMVELSNMSADEGNSGNFETTFRKIKNALLFPFLNTQNNTFGSKHDSKNASKAQGKKKSGNSGYFPDNLTVSMSEWAHMSMNVYLQGPLGAPATGKISVRSRKKVSFFYLFFPVYVTSEARC